MDTDSLVFLDGTLYVWSVKQQLPCHDISLLNTQMNAFAISEDLAFQMTLIKEYVRLYAYKIILSLSNNLYLQQCLTFVRTFSLDIVLY